MLLSTLSARPTLVSLRLRYLFGLAFSVLFLAMAASGQTETNGSTPSGLSRGAPAGSYPLSGFDNVNLYNGHMNFRLPLLGVSGRGSAGYQMTLPIEQTWTIFKQKNEITGVITYHPEPNWWTGIKPGYGAGALQGRMGGTGSIFCGQNSPWYRYSKTLTRLTFTAGDGTEFELRDQFTGGEPRSPVSCTTGFNRGKVFFSADGTAATFISDADIIDTVIVQEDTGTVSPSGYLLLRDGTRYRILNGTIDWMRDRNGNKISFLYDSLKRVTSITDSLGRQISISYAPLNSPGSDVISYSGFGGTARTVGVNYDFLQNALRSDQTLQTLPQLFPDTNNNNNNPYNPIVIKSVTLPNSQQYQLLYNSYGEVARAILPTGAAIEYDYAAGLSDGAASGSFGGGAQGKHVYRRIIERRTYPTGNSGPAYESKMTYSRPETLTPTNLGYVVTEQCISSGSLGVCGGTPALLAKQKHYFYGSPRSSFYQDAVSYGSWQEGREYRTEEYDTNGTTVLSIVEYTFAQRAAVAWWTLDPLGAPPNDPRLTVTKTTIEPNGANLVSKRTAINPQDPNLVGFDQYNNQTDIWDSNFGQGGPGALIRHTHTDYLTTNSANGLAYDTLNPSAVNPNLAATIHLRNLPIASRVYAVNPANGVETLAAQSTISYDEPGYAAPPYVSVTGWIDPGTARGNVTTSGKWLDTTGTYLLTHAQYDQCGNVSKIWDARDTGLTNPTQITYSDAFSDNVLRNTYAFPTSMITAVPDPNGTYGSNVALTTTSVYDFNTGHAVSTTDANAKTTSYDYLDPLDRLKQVTKPDTARVRYNYFDAPGDLYVQVLTDEDSSRSIETRKYFDGLGRPTRGFLLDGTPSTPWLVTDTYYDNMGRVSQVSNPYRVSSPSASVPPTCSVCTTSAYDALGRVKSVTTPDSAQVTTSYGALTSGSIFGTTVLVTDQTGKSRRSLTDSLGRLVRVDEPDINGNLGDVSSPAQPTTYSYDVLGNLRLVTQGAQQRFFMYDSLGRLIRAKNPEQANFTPDTNGFPALTDTTSGISNSNWSTGYIYDANGNLTKRKDARNIVTSYDYDALNRNTTLDYSDTISINPDVTRGYDNASIGANGLGRLWYSYAGGSESTGSNVEHQKTLSYDEVGRPSVQQQRFKTNGAWSQNIYETQRQYNLAGGVTLQIYPSGHLVTYNYDQAGRLGDKDAQNLAFTGNLGDGGVSRAYSSGITYGPLGGLTQEQFGTDTAIYNKLAYNSRGQLAEIKESTTANDSSWDRGKFVNWYSSGCGGAACNSIDNNGNLGKQETFVPKGDGTSVSWYQQYDYDSLNRLQRVHEYTGNTSLDWQQEYVYDRYGNRRIEQDVTKTYGTGINNKNFTANAANDNRLGVPTGQTGTMAYDNAGNLTTDTYSGGAVTRAYDAENRMTSETQANNFLAGSYTYNADGQRVRRTVGGQPSAVTTWQVYGFDGELLAEYDANAAPVSPQKEYGYRNGQLLISADASALPAVPVFSDNYNDNSLDPTKWTIFATTSPAVVSEEAQQLRITLPPNTAGYNGVFSNSTYDMQGKTVQVEVAQTVSQAGWCENYLQVMLDAQNYYLIDVGAGSMVFRSMVNGVNDQTVIGYDPTALPYWRIRHDQTANTASFETSSNGVNWTTRKTVTAAFSLTAVRFYLMAGAWGTGNGSPGAAKYDNFQLAQSGAPPAPVSNLALNKPATQVSTYSTAVAGRAVDGNTDGSYYNNSVTHTAGGSQEWWQVDLGNSYALETIKVWNRTDCCSDRLSNFYVFVSDQPFTSYDLTTTLNQSGVSNFYTAGQGGSPTYINLNRTGRYVRVQLSTPGVLSLAEVQVMGSTVALANLNWLVTDQLGTPRMVFEKSGALANVKRHDYLPFGEESATNQGLRTPTLGYGAADGVRQKFTQKERDNETGLDFFEARYYASTQGRFTSADPVALTVERLVDPQRINLYAYCRNNPLAFIDPTGEIITFANNDARKKYEEYVNFLNTDKKKYAKELATVNRLQGSEVEYRLSVGGQNFEGAEGNTTTDGQRINIAISNVGGSGGETFSLNSRFAHELEHGRQFDNGELIFYKDAEGKWHPSPGTYDIGDEVKAWSAQLDTSIGSDFWKNDGGTPRPSLLREFANAKTDDERAGVLARTSGYRDRNPNQNSNYLYAGKENYKPGQLVRTNDTFGRVNSVAPPRPK